MSERCPHIRNHPDDGYCWACGDSLKDLPPSNRPRCTVCGKRGTTVDGLCAEHFKEQTQQQPQERQQQWKNN